MNRTSLLVNAQQAHKQLLTLWADAKPWLLAGHRLVVTIKPETRSDAANRLLHATIQEVAEQLTWAGKRQEPETWKRLLVASWLRARGESVEILPALDGHGVDVVFRRTSQLTRAECSELQEWIYAWATEQGVRFPAPEYAEA